MTFRRRILSSGRFRPAGRPSRFAYRHLTCRPNWRDLGCPATVIVEARAARGQGARDHPAVLGDQAPHHRRRRGDLRLPGARQPPGRRRGRGGRARHRAGLAVQHPPLHRRRLLVPGLRDRDLRHRRLRHAAPDLRPAVRGDDHSVGRGAGGRVLVLVPQRGHARRFTASPPSGGSASTGRPCSRRSRSAPPSAISPRSRSTSATLARFSCSPSSSRSRPWPGGSSG